MRPRTHFHGLSSQAYRQDGWPHFMSATAAVGARCMAAWPCFGWSSSAISCRHGHGRRLITTFPTAKRLTACGFARRRKRKSGVSSARPVCWAFTNRIRSAPNAERRCSSSILPKIPLPPVCSGATNCWCMSASTRRATTAIPTSLTTRVISAAKAGAGRPTCLPIVGGRRGTIRRAPSGKPLWISANGWWTFTADWVSEATI